MTKRYIEGGNILNITVFLQKHIILKRLVQPELSLSKFTVLEQNCATLVGYEGSNVIRVILD